MKWLYQLTLKVIRVIQGDQAGEAADEINEVATDSKNRDIETVNMAPQEEVLEEI